MGIAGVAIPVRTTLTAERRRHGMIALAKRFWDDESGQGLAEYALLLGLIVIGVVVLIQGMGISIQKIFTKANSDLATAASGLP
jgi:pilus assembly protein Flp/PilA